LSFFVILRRTLRRHGPAAGIAALAIVSAGCEATPVPFATIPAVDPSPSPPADLGREWFLGEGLVRSPTTRTPPSAATHLFVFNPHATPARASVVFYQSAAPPDEVPIEVAPGGLAAFDLAAFSGAPLETPFWVVLRADRPVLPQLRQEEYSGGHPVPDALVATAPYPGPLERERRWVFPDGFQGGSGGWHEHETLTLLNTGPAAAEVDIAYHFRADGRIARERVRVGPHRIALVNLWERRPRAGDGLPVDLVGDYAIRLDASSPIIAQQTRRARWVGHEPVVGARSSFGVPLTEAVPPYWFYPGGLLLDQDTPPRGDGTDHSWSLLFTHNLASAPTPFALTVHGPTGPRPLVRLPAPPHASDLQWLHQAPWLGTYTRVGEPWALSIRTDGPLIPGVTAAEFDAWSQALPGAMTMVDLYPGPLTNERVWWMGIAEEGARAGSATEWVVTYQFFNPGDRAVEVTLSRFGAGAPYSIRTVSVPPGGVAMLGPDDDGGRGAPVAARAEAAAPFVAQVTVRAFVRGVTRTRAMYSALGTPARE